MAYTPKGINLANKVTALTTGTGPTAAQKARIQIAVEVLDNKMRDGHLDSDLTKIYEALNGLS